MKKLFLCVLFPILMMFFLVGQASAQEIENQAKEGKVIGILESGKKTFNDELVEFQVLEIEITRGTDKGSVIQVENSAARLGMVDINFEQFKIGDLIKISTQNDMDGNLSYAVDGQVKRSGLLTLALIFVIVVLLVGRLWGALSLVGLFTSFAVIFKIIIPLIINGTNPILAAILGSIIIIPTTFYISHGWNNKTHVGVITTLVGLIITGFLAVYFVDATHLTGFASEEAGFLQVERRGSIDIRGLLLAGIIIGTLGILDDVTIGQASVVKQLKEAKPEMNWLMLFKNGMKVGQDHISSMVNTLVLVYSGSALPLLLLFFGSEKSFIDILEFELIAEEVVRMLVGSIGLVLSAPMATLLAAYIFSREKKVKL